jgi:hypothetical protein
MWSLCKNWGYRQLRINNTCSERAQEGGVVVKRQRIGRMVAAHRPWRKGATIWFHHQLGFYLASRLLKSVSLMLPRDFRDAVRGLIPVAG